MKEIEGKIKFGVIPVVDELIEVKYQGHRSGNLLSETTEEQAAEFVEGCEDGFGNYENAQLKWFDTAKESLISLLKANDVWIKDWKVENNKGMTIREENEYEQLPDDLLLIKL